MSERHYGELRTALLHPDREHRLSTIARLTEEAIEQTGHGLQLSEADLTGVDLSGANLRRSTLNRASLHGTNFSGADLSEATLICPGMERTNFSGANLRGAYVHALAAQVCKFDGADLSYLLDATGSLFHGCSMRGARLIGSQLAGSMFYQCDLGDADVHGAELQGAAINECVLLNANFHRASVAQLTITKCAMSDASFRDVAGEGFTIQRPTSADRLMLNGAKVPALRLYRVSGKISASGVSAENFSAVECDLRGSSFSGFGGRCATFRDCDLTDVNMAGAYLYRAMLTGDPPSGMSLRNVVLEGANLVQAYIAADLSDANLRNAKLAYARLNQSIFNRADLSGAGVYEASMVKTSFVGAKLADVAPPFFADRCAGLADALRAAGSDNGVRCVENMRSVTSTGTDGST